MLFELIATFAAAFGAAGLVMVLNRILGGTLPRWSTPAAAGLCMIAYAVWSEYTWGARTINGMPEGLLVVQSVEESAVWKPWTYAYPQVTRLIAADKASVRNNPKVPDVRLVDIYIFGRWKAPAQIPQLVHCETGARADVSDAALGDPSQADWVSIAKESHLRKVVCSSN